MVYNEVKNLGQLVEKHQFNLILRQKNVLDNKSYYPKVTVQLGKKIIDTYLDDEYEDLNKENLHLSMCIFLRELEDYQDHEDYLVWCQAKGLSTENAQVRAHHMSLADIYRKVEKIMGKIDSQISDFDFEHNAGAARYLRETKEQNNT